MLRLLLGWLALGVAGAALAQDGGARQQFGPWQYNQERGYYYRKYEYKAAPNDKAYEYQYVIYYKSDPKKQIDNTWAYFYSPKTETYWARYPTVNHPQYGASAKAGKEVWSVLPAAARNKNLYAIDPKAWPTPPANYCPPVPGAVDNGPIQSPPADLP